MTTKVKVISPILVDGAWKEVGDEVDIPHDEAVAHEKAGMVDIVSIDGAPYVWGACCADH